MRQCAPILLFALAVPHVFGQSVISARSGLINYSEGAVLVNGQPLQPRFGTYTSLKEGSDLVTQSGRAEILLTPNTFLRVGEGSGIRMVSDSLGDTRLDLFSGSAVLDSSTAPGKTPITITLRDSSIRFLAPGKFRLDSDPPQLRVFEGVAEVENDGQKVKVESSQLLPLDGASIVRKFTGGSDNLLDLWSDERHTLIANNLTDSQRIGDPLLDSDSTIPGNSANLGYAPLAVYPPLIGGTYPGLLGGYDTYGYNTYGYNPYGIYSPYSAFGIYGGLYGYAPVYSNTLRPGALVGLSSPVLGVRPIVGTGASPGPFRFVRPSPITIRPAAPRPLAPHVAGHR